KLSWTGTSWVLRDLGSRNGTFVDGRRVEPGQLETVAEGNRIGLGEMEPVLEIIDAGKPGLIAIRLSTGEARAAEGDLLALPNDGDPAVSIYPDPRGLGWVLEELEGGARPVEDKAVIEVRGEEFRLELPGFGEPTPAIDVSPSLGETTLRFIVSPDE